MLISFSRAKKLTFLQATDGLFDADGNIGAGSNTFLQSWMDAFVDWVKLHYHAADLPQLNTA